MRILCALASLLAAGSAWAGSYVKDFTGLANGLTSLGDGSYMGSTPAASPAHASVQAERLRLSTNGVGSLQSLFRLPDLDPGREVTGFHLEFDLILNGGGGNPADGVSFNFGGLVLTDQYGPGEEGYQLPGGMVISFDTYVNNPPETTRTLDVRIDGNQLVSVPESTFGNYQFNGTAKHVVINWDAAGFDMTFGGTTICDNLAVPGLHPQSGDRFAFSARTGGATEDVFLDNINFATTPATPITRPSLALSEMVIDNTKYDDEHSQSPGYVEIYNGTAAAVSLNGWSLTDDPATPAKWTFPAGQTIASYGYTVVFFGHGTPAPVTPDTKLHTTFVPIKTGGFIGLYQGAAKIDSFEPYPAQVENVSYGHLGNAWTLGFLETPSPGFKNSGLQEAGPPVKEEVVWPRDGGLIDAPISLTLGAPTTPGAQIRYTLDNSAPTPSSTLYDYVTPATIPVSASTNVRARIFASGRLPGSVTSRTFLKLNSNISSNYRGTGQPFSSNLPVIVIDSFGRSLDSENSATPGARPFRYTYAVVLDKDPAKGNRTLLTPAAPVDFQGRSGMHVRGESSSGMPQRQYSWETVDNEGNDKDVSILGMPAESDWVLYAPATDKTLLRNFIAYNTMRDTNGFGSAMRARLVEVFFNQPALGGVSTDTSPEVTWADYRGVYVLVEKIKRGNDRVDIAKLNPADTDPSLISGGYIFKKDKPSTDPDFTTVHGQLLQITEPETTVNDPQWSWLRTYVNAFENALYGTSYADPALGYRAYIDEQSFMDNQWWVEIFKQIDGYRLSTYFSKDRGGKIKAAPLWDYNLSMGNAYYLDGYKYTGWYSNLLGSVDYQYYYRLRQDPDYTLRHFDRYWKLRKSTFNTAAIVSRIDGYINEVMDGQPLVNVTNGTGVWPNSTPSAELPAARHHARWQRLGIYDWPNAPGFTNRSKFASTTDATNYTNFAASGYVFPATSDDATIAGQGTAVVAMSEVVHLKAHLVNRLKWTDNGYILSNVVLRPPAFSQDGGNVSAGYNLTISAYSGTPPAAVDYGFGGTLRYASGPIYYTTDGTEVYTPGSTAPSATAQLYNGPIVLNAPTTVRARQFDTAASKWSPMTDATFVVSTVPVSASNLVVSEIMYNPATPSPAEVTAGFNDANMFEYLEVMNIGNSTIDLSGVAFTTGVTFTWPASIPSLRVLAPGERAVIAGNLAAFNLRYAPAASVKIAGVFSGNLSNGGEQITITGPGGVIRDFTFDDDPPWPTGADGAGYSLVLNNPASNPDHSLPQNWRSSFEVNGTPGAAPGPSGPTGAAALADTDKDGFSDLMEYATGSLGNNGSSQPSQVNGTVSLIVPPATTPSTYLTFEYKRSRSADGFSLDAEVSTGLSGWQPISSMFTMASQTNNADGTATIVWRSNQPASSVPGRLFFHLRAGITP